MKQRLRKKRLRRIKEQKEALAETNRIRNVQITYEETVKLLK